MRPIRLFHGVALGSLCLAIASRALAEEPKDPEAEQKRIEAWLGQKPGQADASRAPDVPEAPPPPPRKHGFVVEASLGAMGQAGALRHVSPTSPWFRAAFGWEPTRWLMLLAQTDVAVGSTTYAKPPPDPRSFALVGVSVGLRFGFSPWETVGFYAQGEVGGAEVTSDVLASYGFTDADKLGPYFGALAGIEWYQVSPHLALVVNGGVRSYGQILDRTIGSESPLAWVMSAGLKHTF